MRAALRGGNFNNAGNAGAFALNVNNAPSNSNAAIGFRAGKAQVIQTDGHEDFRPQCRVPWNRDPYQRQWCCMVKNKKRCAPLVGSERGAFFQQAK